jgi:hypothetical protein
VTLSDGRTRTVYVNSKTSAERIRQMSNDNPRRVLYAKF